MTKGDLLRILREWQRRLWLERWEIELQDEPADAEALASITPNRRRKHARLYLSAEWEKWSVEQTNATLVHELLHLHHSPVDAVADELLIGQLQRDVVTVFDRAYELAMENAIDDLSRIIVQLGGAVS